MRNHVAALVLLAGFPGLASAQALVTTLPPIGLPLPQISQPLPLIGMEPWQLDGPAAATDNGEGRRHRTHDRRRGHPQPAFVYFVSPYWPDAAATPGASMPGVIVSAPVATPPEATTGLLRLDVTPADVLQVFVDGAYVGTPADFGNALELAAGTRRVELRAPGYEPLTIDVKIAAGGTVSYRGALEPIAAAALRPTEPAGHRTFYLIPGCYIGNVPPEHVKLPPGCDTSRVIVHTPQ